LGGNTGKGLVVHGNGEEIISLFSTCGLGILEKRTGKGKKTVLGHVGWRQRNGLNDLVDHDFTKPGSSIGKGGSVIVARESKQGAIKEKGPRIQVDITSHNALQTGGEVGVILEILDPVGECKARTR
jgi:hypothetical protein